MELMVVVVGGATQAAQAAASDGAAAYKDFQSCQDLNLIIVGWLSDRSMDDGRVKLQ